MIKKILLIAIVTFSASCKEASKEIGSDPNTSKETVMDEKQNDDYRTIFNGENLEGWKVYNSEETSNRWTVEDSTLIFTPSNDPGTENLITEEEFTSFELSLEWKIQPGGNSGIMWAVQEGEAFNEPYITGPEIQILDNQGHPDAENGPIRQAGALYDMVPPNEDVTKPAGEWNETLIRIDYEKNEGKVVMNGTPILEFPLYGEKWDQLKENSKFKDWDDFGKYKSGHIALQDHGDKVWYRNIRIKEL